MLFIPTFVPKILSRTHLSLWQISTQLQQIKLNSVGVMVNQMVAQRS